MLERYNANGVRMNAGRLTAGFMLGIGALGSLGLALGDFNTDRDIPTQISRLEHCVQQHEASQVVDTIVYNCVRAGVGGETPGSPVVDQRFEIGTSTIADLQGYTDELRTNQGMDWKLIFGAGAVGGVVVGGMAGGALIALTDPAAKSERY